jgi:hypothetical protein
MIKGSGSTGSGAAPDSGIGHERRRTAESAPAIALGGQCLRATTMSRVIA